MRNTILSIVLLAFALTFTAAPASAESPHYIGSVSCTKSLSTGLTCSGKVAGLDEGVVSAFLTAQSETATYECKNHGGNVAPGQPLVLSPVTGPSKDITARNGQITFSVTIPPPPTPSSSTTCPNGNWSVNLLSLSYTNVVLNFEDSAQADVSGISPKGLGDF